jgi:hypothetical protein
MLVQVYDVLSSIFGGLVFFKKKTAIYWISHINSDFHKAHKRDLIDRNGEFSPQSSGRIVT